MHFNVLLILFLASIQQVYLIGSLKIKSIRLSRCSNDKNFAAQITHLNYYRKDGWFFFNVEANLTRNTPKIAKLTITLHKCADEASLDTCMLLTKPTVPNICNLLDAKNQVWTPLVNCINPRPACSMNKAIMIGRNCTFDIDVLNRIVPVVGNAYWKANIEVTGATRNDKVLCFNCDNFDTTWKII